MWHIHPTLSDNRPKLSMYLDSLLLLLREISIQSNNFVLTKTNTVKNKKDIG